MESFKSKNSLARVRKPVNLACGLPNSHYIDETVFNREKDSLLFDNWAGIGFEKDVPNKGDVYPVYFLGMPLLLVRDQDNMPIVKDIIIEILKNTYGRENALIWFQRWRIFFMACEELFGMYDGKEWYVSHYLFRNGVKS